MQALYNHSIVRNTPPLKNYKEKHLVQLNKPFLNGHPLQWTPMQSPKDVSLKEVQLCDYNYHNAFATQYPLSIR